MPSVSALTTQAALPGAADDKTHGLAHGLHVFVQLGLQFAAGEGCVDVPRLLVFVVHTRPRAALGLHHLAGGELEGQRLDAQQRVIALELDALSIYLELRSEEHTSELQSQ